MVGRYGGQSKPAEPGEDRELIRRPTYFVHGTTWSAATSILLQGLKADGRQEIHMVPLHMSTRQEAYAKSDARKTHLLVVDGDVASAAGITFRKLENDVTPPRDMGGTNPPCCITSNWRNK